MYSEILGSWKYNEKGGTQEISCVQHGQESDEIMGIAGSARKAVAR